MHVLFTHPSISIILYCRCYKVDLCNLKRSLNFKDKNEEPRQKELEKERKTQYYIRKLD